MTTRNSGRSNGQYKHGFYKEPEYHIWREMKRRCYSPSNCNYYKYGAKGIRVCRSWMRSFAAFLSDMGKRPSHKHSIERRNNKGHYTPTNCYWALPEQQQNNKSTCVYITYHGRTMTVAQWARAIGIETMTLRSRLWRGWSVERALTSKCKRT